MADLLKQGAEWLDNQRHEQMTQTVTYYRGVDSVELLATIAQTEFEQADESGFIHRIEGRDFIVRTADLVLDSETVLPMAGDLIRETDGEVTQVYEVMAPNGEPPWRYSDLYRIALRIHTKHIKTETDGP